MDQIRENQNKIEEIRAQHRWETNERRKQKIHDLLTIKRKWPKDENQLEITHERVAEWSKRLKKEKKIEILKYLSDAFSRGQEYINIFLNIDGALYALIGCLIGKDVNIKLASVVCLINLGTGDLKSTLICIKSSSAYLLAFLGNGSHELQELCIWALGNFASDCEKCSEILRKQGFIDAVMKLLKSENDKVKYSTYFALACYIRVRRKKIDQELLNHETLELILHPLIYSNCIQTKAECASIIFHFTCSGENDEKLVSSGIINKIIPLLLNYLQTQPDAITIIAPLLRSLANLCSCDVNIVKYCVDKEEFAFILYLLTQSRYNFIVKESLWLIANVVGCNEGVDVVSKNGLLMKIAELSESIGALSLQALICLCNLASFSRFSHVLVREIGIFDRILRLLQRDVETCKGCLTLIIILLENCDLGKCELLGGLRDAIGGLRGSEGLGELCDLVLGKLN